MKNSRKLRGTRSQTARCALWMGVLTAVSLVAPMAHADDNTAAASQAGNASKRTLIVLPLDHGPRATTTPELNKKRLEAARKAQQEAASANKL